MIVGLGNPGGTYQWTRHNIGFQVLDRLAEESHISLGHKQSKAQYGKGFVHSRDVLLVKPLTFMNLSGLAVKRIIHYYKAGPEDLMVIHDDLDLPFGALRIKRWGGDGGHQGVRSMIDSMGGNNFLRLKVGIGRPPRGMDPADYVLRFFDELERTPVGGGSHPGSRMPGRHDLRGRRDGHEPIPEKTYSPFSISIRIFP